MAATVHPSGIPGADVEAASSEDKERRDVRDGRLTDGMLAEKSLGLFPIESRFRQQIIQLVSPGSRFDDFILFVILMNSVAMASVDYSYIDENYNPRTDLSIRNNIIEKAEYCFSAIFIAEFLLKCVAFGFAKGRNAYIRDGWNKLDFIIVFISIVGMVPRAPNLSAIRSFRVLRPLRSISKLPSLRKIICALIDSLEDLATVMFMLLFLLACFTMFGVTFWRGLFHSRCRLTPFPVKMSTNCRHITDPCWEEFVLDAATNPEYHKCLPYLNDDQKHWSQETSPWFLHGPQDCVWPLDESDQRVCSFTGYGRHGCSKVVAVGGYQVSRTCGSNYDAFGNPRFIDSHEPYGYPRMRSGVFSEELNWGYTNYDNFLSAFVTTFQVITLEGWSEVMYRIIDSWSIAPTIFVFSVLIVLGGHIVMSIVLAVITSSLDKIDEQPDKQGASHCSSKGVDQEENSNRTNLLRLISDSEVVQQLQRATLPLRSNIREWIEGNIYQNAVMGSIVINTVILSLDHFGISSELEKMLEQGNFIFSVIFLIDMILCNISYGLRAFWSSASTCFDGVVVLCSLVELSIARAAGGDREHLSAVSVFRSIRLVRLFKLAKKWESLHALLETTARAASDIRSFGLLLSLFVLIYALIGMQLFSNRMHFDETTGAPVAVSDPAYGDSMIPRSHFDDLFWSVTTIFQVLSGENWNSVMYDSWRATSWIAAIYFTSLVLLGIFVVLNLFLAILLKRFDDNESLATTSRIYPETQVVRATNPREPSLVCQVKSKLIHCKDHRNNVGKIWGIQLHRIQHKVTQCMEGKAFNFGKTWGIQFHRIQHKVTQCVEGKAFEIALTALIVMCSILLALSNPLDNPNTPKALIISRLSGIFTALFVAEFFVKIFIYGPKKYFQDSWNFLDCASVVASALELSNVNGGRSLSVLRTLRILRPLRMIHRFPEVKLVVDALLLSMPSVGNVAVICAVFFLIFSIFGVTFLKGTFYRCLETSLTPQQVQLVKYPRPFGELNNEEKIWFDMNSTLCVVDSWESATTPTSKEICDCLVPGNWIEVVPQNFNNALNGFALLFEVSTTEGWVDVMHAAIDQRGIDAQPVRDNNRTWAIFFVLFIVLGAFFILELFVGVIIENFAKIRDTRGNGLMTEAQKRWASTQEFVMKIKPEKRIPRPRGRIQSSCYDFVMPGTNPWFRRGIAGVIILNCICTAVVSFGDSNGKTQALAILNIIFLLIFIIEVMMKITAFNMKYFQSGWNRFDFIIVCGLTTGMLIKTIFPIARQITYITSLISLFRIGRLIRLIRHTKRLQAPFNILIAAIPSIANIGALLVLLFFIYGICGVQLYSQIAYNDELNEQSNFRSLGNAMLILLRFSTGENWNGFMWSLLENKDGCDSDPTYNDEVPWCLREQDYPHCAEVNGCGAGFSVFIYFYSFTLLVSYVVLNMFVGVILEAFENSKKGDILLPKDLDNFTKVWAEFDPNATWHIKAHDVNNFLAKLPPPLGIGNPESQVENELVNRVMTDQCLLEIPVNDQKEVNIVHVATNLAKRLAKEKQGENFGELGDEHPIQRRIKMQKEGMNLTLGDVYFSQAKTNLSAIRKFKALLSKS